MLIVCVMDGEKTMTTGRKLYNQRRRYYNVFWLCKRAFLLLLLFTSTKCWVSSENLHDKSTTPHGFTIQNKKLVYNGWRTIVQQDVKMRSGKTVSFDIVGLGGNKKNGGSAVTVFCWDTQTKTATLVREYHPGPHELLIGCAAGIVEEGEKHKGDNPVLVAAQMELEEECHLRGGTWIPLVSKPIAMDKYTSTTIFAYLVLDPTHVSNPRPRDEEEDIEIVQGLSCAELLQMLRNGKMNLVGSWICLLAMDKLRELGEIE